MTAFKQDRYGGALGGFRWARDKIFGMPSAVDEFYRAGRELYLQRMDGVISHVADIVGNDLAAAKKRIASGRSSIDAYVRSLPAELRKIGSGAASEIGERFAELESEVDAKQQAAVDGLAAKYVEGRRALDTRIEEMQQENKGLVDKAIAAVKAVVGIVADLAVMLRTVLARAVGVVGEIVKRPVQFLGNLIEGVKRGFLRFSSEHPDPSPQGVDGLAVRCAAPKVASSSPTLSTPRASSSSSPRCSA